MNPTGPAAVAVPDGHKGALQRLSRPEYVRQHRKEPLREDVMHPLVLDFAKQFLRDLWQLSIPFYAFELYRSPERQAVLHKNGVTKAGPGESPHQWGCAVDLIDKERLWDLRPKEWALIGALGKETARRRNIPIVWGGDWGWDFAHWELENFRQWRRFGEYVGFENYEAKMHLLRDAWDRDPNKRVGAVLSPPTDKPPKT